MHRYLVQAFPDRLGEARAAMEELAASLPPEELNHVGLCLYQRFRPNAPTGAEGCTANGTCGSSAICGRALKRGALVRLSARRIHVATASARPRQSEFVRAHIGLPRIAAWYEADSARPTYPRATAPGWQCREAF